MMSAAGEMAEGTVGGRVAQTVKEAKAKAREEEGVIGKTATAASHVTGKAQEGIGEIAGNQDEVARVE